VAWSPPPSRPRRELTNADATERVQPIRSETRARLVEGIAKARLWVDDLLAGRVTSTHDIARRDDLSVELLHALAAHIVQFHDKAERVLDRGGATAMAELVRTNLAILRSCRAAGFAAPQLDRIECMLTAELAQTRALLEDRRQAGKVRRCHGDLHLRNICMVDGKPLLFDCIEFSEAIASIDVLYDVAFLLMDLEHRGHRHSRPAAHL